MRRLNLVFLGTLLAALLLLGGGMRLVHDVQVRRNATALLDSARHAEADHHLEVVEQSLTFYLNLRRDDGPAWEWYARIREERDPDPRHREQIFLVHEEALRHNPGNGKLRRRCVDLALELGRYADAQNHLQTLIEKVSQDAEKQSASSEMAELEDLEGQCERGVSRYEQAEQWFLQALRHDPHRVSCYERLARLRRTGSRKPEAAADTIKEMVAKNPKAGRAYLYRWRYAQEFLSSADPNDLQIALGLAPNDPEVLLAAAVASEQKPDAAAARRYFEKGCRQHPKNAAFALGLAHLESREGHLDRAEAVLRRADEAKPSPELAFVLAEALIFQDKIDGKDQAAACIARLRKAGFGDTLVRFLEAEILVQRKQWAEAIPRLEIARAVLESAPQLSGQLNLMLADCYGRVGSDEQRRDALGRAAAGERAGEPTRLEYARALARSGEVDKALTILAPLAEHTPEPRLDVLRLLIQKTSRQPEAIRDWQEVERYLSETAKAFPQAVEPLTLLRADLLAARDRVEDARALLSAARAKDPKDLRYRLALARLTQRQRHGPVALQILDQAETELGPSLDIQLARLDYWDTEGGDEARAAVTKLAEDRHRMTAADQPAFLDRLGSVEVRLGEPARAREHWRELAGLRPANVQVLMALFDLAIQAANHTDALEIVSKLRKIEGEPGTLWRFGQASCLLDQARRGTTTVDLKVPRGLAAAILAHRPDWWGSSVLLAELAELEGQTDEAIKNYTRALELGNDQPILARRLFGLLSQRDELDQIDRVVKILADRDSTTSRELTVASALKAIRQQDYDRGIALARAAYSERSTHFADHLFLGRFYLAARRPREAGKELHRAVELGPGVPLAWVSYVEYLVRENQVDQARGAVAAARRALPADRANSALAQCYAMVGDVKQAEALIQSALRSPGCDLTTVRVATDLYINLGRFDQVEAILDKLRDPALKATPADLAWVRRSRTLVLMSTGHLAEMDRALTLVEQNLKANPASLDDLRLKAVLLALRTSRRGDAIKLLEPFEESNRLGAYEQFILAQTYLAERLLDKYRAQMLKMLAVGVKNPRHLVHFISFLIDHQELDQANYWLAELQKVAPQSPIRLELEARLLKARNRDDDLRELLLARGRQFPDEIGTVAGLLDRFGFAREADAAYKSFIARNPNQPERTLSLASFLARQDRINEAVAILDQAWTTCRPEAVAGISLALYVTPSADDNLRRRVETWVTEAIRRNPAEAEWLRPKLANIYCMQERYDEAETLYRQVLASDPDNIEALGNLAWELALREPAKPHEALELVNRAIERAGRTSVLVNARAVALIRAGELDRAVQELLDAQAASPGDPSLALNLAWVYQEKGRSEEARKAFVQAKEQGLDLQTTGPLQRGIIDCLRRKLGVKQPSPSKHS